MTKGVKPVGIMQYCVPPKPRATVVTSNLDASGLSLPSSQQIGAVQTIGFTIWHIVHE